MAENPFYIYTVFILFEQNQHGKYSQMIQTCNFDELLPVLDNMIDNYFNQLCPYIDVIKLLSILENYDLVKMDVFNISELNFSDQIITKSIIIKLYFIICVKF